MPAFAPIRQRSPTEIDLLAAAGQGAHDRRAAADVGAVADDHAGRDPALDHGRAERAGVVVDEALVHDRGALGQVRAQPDPVGVGDPHPGRQHVVDHPGELVHAVHGRPGRGGAAAAGSASKSGTGHGPWLVHTTLASSAEDAVQVAAVRADQAVGQQVQPQVRVVRVGQGRRPGGRWWCGPRRPRPPGPRPGRAARPRRGRAPRPPRPQTAGRCRWPARPGPVPARGTRCPAPSRPDPPRRSPPWPGRHPRPGRLRIDP